MQGAYPKSPGPPQIINHKQAENEKLLRAFTENCTDGMFATTEEAIEALATPVVKTMREYKTFEGQLTLGDPIKYPNTAVSIDVARYFKTHQAKPVSARSFVERTADEVIDLEMPDAGDLTSVRQTRVYKVNDPSAPGGKRDVDRDILEKGYEYGSTIVPINKSDENVTKLEAIRDFSIIGFVPDNVSICISKVRLCIV